MDINWELSLVATGLFFTAMGSLINAAQTHYMRKSLSFEIEQRNRDRYANILKNRSSVQHYYIEKDFYFDKVETKEDRQKIIAAEYDYFWFAYDTWKAGHIYKSIPKSVCSEWDYGIQSAMQNPVHRYMWQNFIKDTLDAKYKKEFSSFIKHLLARNQQNKK